ncbi:MAG: hypothetical protein RL701_595 [Pseudomonadota bacterium]
MTIDRDNSIERSHQLSQQQVADAVSPHALAGLLFQAGATYVMIGGHVLGYLTGNPRATVDVDVIVSTSHIAKAVKAVHAKFPELVSEDLVYNVRFNSKQGGGRVSAERIDLVRDNVPLFNRILNKYAVSVQAMGQVLQLPTAEAAVALKFAAAISPNRGNENRPQDRADLLAIVTKHRALKHDVLNELGDLVYPGGGQELKDFCNAVWRGETPTL